MKYFIRVIKEIRNVLSALMVFEILLNTLLIFMLSLAILTFLNVNVLYALTPSVLYLIIGIAYRLKTNKLLLVEQKYPILKEKLRTASDNLGVENPVINELHEDIVAELKNVEASSFINMFSYSHKILMALALAVSIVIAAQNQVSLDYQKLIFNNPLVNYIKANQEVNKAVVSNKVVDFGSENVILGEEISIVKNREEKLDVLIDASGYEINLKNEEEREDIETFPSELCYQTQQGCEAVESFNENIPKENTDLIKRYFKNLAQSK